MDDPSINDSKPISGFALPLIRHNINYAELNMDFPDIKTEKVFCEQTVKMYFTSLKTGNRLL